MTDTNKINASHSPNRNACDKLFNVAVVGATGIVGRKVIEILGERNFPIRNLFLFASAKSKGKILDFNGKPIEVEVLSETNFADIKPDVAIFSAGSAVSGEFAPIFAKKGIPVVDNSERWRKDADVPLIVPEINPTAISGHKNIIANPNCSTIQAAIALYPLHQAFGTQRIIFTTFQSVSGAGRDGCRELLNKEKSGTKKFPRRIYSNVIPQIGNFDSYGYCEEENKMIFETHKIFGDDKIRITATTARVPVFFGHCISANVRLGTRASFESVTEILKNARGVKFFDGKSFPPYPTTPDAVGQDDVLVGRLRKDNSDENSFNMWIVADNIRKGAATNAVQIAELLLGIKNPSVYVDKPSIF